MGRIALQDLRQPEKVLTYTYSLRLRRLRKDFMNKGEVYTKGNAVPRTANLNDTKTSRKKDALKWESIDWISVEAFINKVQTRIAKATVAGNKKLVRELQRMLTH
jgi:hypothetical protein